MRKFILILLLYGTHAASAQLFKTDTFAYSINLDASVNNYLKTLPIDLLKGYCSGKWNAFYPKYEYNQCLWNDYLAHYQTANNNEQNLYCIDDYCSQPYFKALYDNFTRKIGYREIYYFDAKHSVIKRELLSIPHWRQLAFTAFILDKACFQKLSLDCTTCHVVLTTEDLLQRNACLWIGLFDTLQADVGLVDTKLFAATNERRVRHLLGGALGKQLKRTIRRFSFIKTHLK